MLGSSSLGPYFFGVTRLTGLRLRVLDIYIYYSNILVTSQQASACWFEIALRHYVMLIYTGLSSRAELVTDLEARDGTYLALEVDPATMAGSGGLRKSAST